MNKTLLIGLLVIVIVVGAGGFVAINKKPDVSNVDSVAKTAKAPANYKKACELITLEDAKLLLGESATLSEGSGSDNLATTDSVTTDNCTYSADGATLGDLNQITIQGQYGDGKLVNQAYDSNRKQFPGDDIAGLGDKAYFSTEAKQVNVLKNDYWFFVFGGSMNAGDDANKELALKAAKIAAEKL